MVYLIRRIEGLEIIDINARLDTAELDIIVRNLHRDYPIGFPLFREATGDIIIECKNWNKPVSASEIRDFHGKLVKYKSLLGIFVSKNGYTKDALKEILDIYQREGRLIIPLDLSDLARLKKENLLKILLQKRDAIRYQRIDKLT